MRNLFHVILCCLLLHFSVGAQPLKVEGSTAGGNGIITTQFTGDYFTVLRNDGYAVVDLNGKTVISGIKAPHIDFITRKLVLYHDIFFADETGSIVLKNIKGLTLGTGKYMEINPFVTDNTAVRVPSAPATWIVAYLDTAGKEIVRFDVRKYLALVDPQDKTGVAFVSLADFLPFSEGLTPIKSKVTGKYGFINKKLQLVIPVAFREATPFSDGLAAVQNADGNWGFINTAGKQVIPFDYSRRPSRFMSGLARVENKEGRLGFVNKANQVVITPKYAYATCFYNGFALAREGFDKPICLIDTTGTVVATFPKDLLYIDDEKLGPGISGGEAPYYPFYVSETLRELVDEGKGIFKKGMSNGLMDNKGNVVLDFKYQYLADFHNGKLFAYSTAFINNSTHHDFGIMNDKGEWLIQIVSSGF